ncbi:b78b73a4-0bda-43e9-a777-ac6f376a00a4 [Sclerotinia trifoliorum]|uniref:B78b73a4-0bda-43e9-a777-ac6f376a00a4 n=1 Tax=Sclerotinia trifoliorum TaxID=28548 RepID=A0A8H2VN42_9HELO|nr:b78b73a4-0bda-43e9-a777-ac6f376a00a4 [Sclerotinia trifoliorum]
MDQSLPDHYETLGISYNAVAQDIKKAFFALAKTHHPDKNNGGPTKEFVRTAYEVLSDRDQRNIYDRQFQNVRPSVEYQTWKAPDNYTYERKRERRYSYRIGSSASEAPKCSDAQEAEERRKTEEENIRKARESLDALMKELEAISERLERRQY